MMLSGETMTIAAGSEDDNGAMACTAAKDAGSAGIGSAAADGRDYLTMIGWKVLREFFQVCRSELPEDFSDGSHNQLLS